MKYPDHTLPATMEVTVDFSAGIRKKAEAKGKKAKPVVKAGAKKVADPQGTQMRKQQQRLQKSGRIEDAIDLIMRT